MIVIMYMLRRDNWTRDWKVGIAKLKKYRVMYKRQTHLLVVTKVQVR